MSFWYPLVGGLMLGSCVHHLLYFNGNVLGISGIYGTTVRSVLSLIGGKSKEPEKKEIGTTNGTAANGTVTTKREAEDGSNWKLVFTAGLLAGGFLLRLFRPYLERKLGIPLFDDAAVKALATSSAAAFFGGAVVGLGTKLAGGCTSGHMLCGISRLSWRSIIATATFFSTAVAVVKLHPSPSISSPSSISSSSVSVDVPTLLLLQLPVVFYRYVIPNSVSKRRYKPISSFFIAIHFSFGLALAGMLQPSKIQNFLVLPTSPSFDPSLAFVAIGALLPNLISWTQWIRDSAKPVYAAKFDLPTRRDIDSRLVAGSVLFGAGWGWLGICPGPGLVVLLSVNRDILSGIGTWVLGLTVGGLLVPK